MIDFCFYITWKKYLIKERKNEKEDAIVFQYQEALETIFENFKMKVKEEKTSVKKALEMTSLYRGFLSNVEIYNLKNIALLLESNNEIEAAYDIMKIVIRLQPTSKQYRWILDTYKKRVTQEPLAD